jgi:RND family efflux transporter MFP subunit
MPSCWKRLATGRLLLASLLVLGPGRASAESPEAPPAPRAASLVGVVVASQIVELVPRVEGRLDVLKVRLGDRVSSGQELALVELQPLEQELAARQANLQAAQADHSRSAILLTQAQQRLEREKRIREYSAAETLEQAQSQVALALVDVELAKARVAEAQARLDQAASNLANARLRAPFAGVVAEILLQPGNLVGRTTPILRLVSQELRLRFAVPPSLAGTLHTGTEVHVRVESLHITLTGSVDSISPELDPASRHLRAEARLNIPPVWKGRIPSGVLAEVELRPASRSAPSASKGP